MGQNRRYGSDVSDESVVRAVTRPRPITLTPAEVGATSVPDAAEPIPVHAWVRFPETPVRVKGRAVAWTDRAVLVEFSFEGGPSWRTWVWASAVSRV